MFELLDAKTIFVLTGILSVLISIVFIAIHRGVHGVIEGVLSFAWSYAFFALFALLIMLRGVIPDLISIVIADTALCMCLLMLLDGCLRVKQYPTQPRFNRVLLMLCLTGFAWFTYGHESFTARVFITIVVSVLVFCWVLLLLLREDYRTWRMGEWILAVALMISLLAAVMRADITLNEMEHSVLKSIFAYQGAQAHYLMINLIATVFIAIGSIVIIQDELRKDLEKIASYDALTGVLTRRVILNLLDKAIAKVMRNHHPLALMMIDLDHFKRINDTYGHRVGDEVLVTLMAAVESALRKDTYIGRYGGEEFLVIMPDTDAEQLSEVSERIRHVASQSKIKYENKQIHCTISIGAVIIDGDNVNRILDPVSIADKALYQAKIEGRDRVVIANTAGSQTQAV